MMFESCKRLALAGPLAVCLAAASCGGDPDLGDVDPNAVQPTNPDAVVPESPDEADPVVAPPVAPEPPKTAADYPDLVIETMEPGAEDAVVLDNTHRGKFHYTGYLRDGTQFDSSFKTGNPIEVNMAQPRVIQGWALGLIGMKVGEKRRLTIPPELGYGPSGSRSIPPNATLKFDIELVEIVTPDQ